MADLLPVGTRIRFKKTLTEAACEDHPGLLYAIAGDLGTITGHGTKEGYWAKTDSWHTPFGASADEFEVVTKCQEPGCRYPAPLPHGTLCSCGGTGWITEELK